MSVASDAATPATPEFEPDPDRMIVGPTGRNGVRLHVPGIPQTQAGMKSVPTAAGRRRITEGSNDLLPWRQAIAAAAERYVREHGGFGDLAVRVAITFRFPMPPSRPKYQRVAGVCFHALRRDDLDKLERAVLDGITFGGLIDDDGYVVKLSSEKYEVGSGQWTGADVFVTAAVLDLDALEGT